MTSQKIISLIEETAVMPYDASVSSVWNAHGTEVTSVRFHSADNLVDWFGEYMPGNPIMKGHSSKAIGSTLLIWKR